MINLSPLNMKLKYDINTRKHMYKEQNETWKLDLAKKVRELFGPIFAAFVSIRGKAQMLSEPRISLRKPTNRTPQRPRR